MIEIAEFKKISVGCKIAEFDVTIPSIGIIFRGMTLLQKGERRWVSFASKSRAGEPSPVYFQCGGFTDSDKEYKFLKLVLEDVEKRLSEEVVEEKIPEYKPVDFSQHIPPAPERATNGNLPF